MLRMATISSPRATVCCADAAAPVKRTCHEAIATDNRAAEEEGKSWAINFTLTINLTDYNEILPHPKAAVANFNRFLIVFID